MGVDYLKCDGCDNGYRDDSEYCCSCDCGSSFCRLGCGKLENYFNPYLLDENNGRRIEVNEDENSPRWEEWDNGNYVIDDKTPITCVICRKESHNDYVLLQALLKHFNLTKAQAVKIYKGQKD
jgi:hypothetical protein